MNKKWARDKIKTIAIAGAGPAGTSLAIRLAQTGFDVTLLEKERFPRHKLCGEFISPECLEHFRELGVFEKMLASGGDRIGTTIFYAPNGRSVDVPSEWFVKGSAGALSLSRARMDHLLLKRARKLGVEVFEESAVKEIALDGNLIRGISGKNGNKGLFEISADVYVDATGRAGILSKLSERSIGVRKQATKQKWVGFKAHFENANMRRGRCEIYFFRGGYGGLSHVERDRTNHCFLIRSDVVRKFGGNADKVFREVVLKNTRASITLGRANRVTDWLSVSIGEFGRKKSSSVPNLFSVGDSAAFIDPFTGSGMLMALENSQVLAQCLETSNGTLKSIGAAYELEYRKRFSNRLRVCNTMRNISFSPRLAEMAIRCLKPGGILRYGIARATRTA